MFKRDKSLPADGYLLVTFASSLEQMRPKHALGVIWIQMVCNSGGVSERNLDIFLFLKTLTIKITKNNNKKKTVDVYKLTKKPSVQENSDATDPSSHLAGSTVPCVLSEPNILKQGMATGRGNQYVNGNAFITPPLRLYALCGTNDQRLTLKLVIPFFIYLSFSPK